MSKIPIYNYSYNYQNIGNFPTHRELVGLHTGHSLCSLCSRNLIIMHEYGR